MGTIQGFRGESGSGYQPARRIEKRRFQLSVVTLEDQFHAPVAIDVAQAVGARRSPAGVSIVGVGRLVKVVCHPDISINSSIPATRLDPHQIHLSVAGHIAHQGRRGISAGVCHHLLEGAILLAERSADCCANPVFWSIDKDRVRYAIAIVVAFGGQTQGLFAVIVRRLNAYRNFGDGVIQHWRTVQQIADIVPLAIKVRVYRSIVLASSIMRCHIVGFTLIPVCIS